QAIVSHDHVYPRHALHFGADLGGDLWEHLPQAAARAAIANCK
ncbi:unnamed protein product, partial [marine sediment metagenome]